MMKLILIAVLASFSLAAAANQRCALGESLWCSSLQYATLCGAVDHCRTTAWTNQILAEDPSEVCEFCQVIVADVAKYIKENKTEAEISQFLSSACDLVPDKAMSTECKTIVQTYLPQIVDLITKETDPKVICGLVGLCKSLPDYMVKIETTTIITTPQDPAICTDCKKFVQDIKDYISSNATQNEIAELVNQYVCQMFGSLQKECNDLVKEFLPEILQLLSSGVNVDQLCQPFCMKKSMQEMRIYFISLRLMKSPLFLAAKQKSAEECVACKTIMGELQTLDRDQTVQNEVKNLIKTQICARLSVKAECDLTVDLYASELFELLATELDPVTRCTSLGFCSAVSDPVRESMPKKPVKASPECMICEFVLTELKAMIGDNVTEDKVIAALEKVCQILPATVRDSCTSFISLYGKEILDLLLQDVSPEQVCTELHLCTSTASNLPTQTVTISTQCVVCENLVQYAEDLLDQNSTIAEIEGVVMKICNLVPATMKQECSSIVQEFGGLIVHYIATSLSPQEICTLIKLCSTQTVKMESLVPAKVRPATLYYKCTYGPSYWCTSKENAELCQAVDHCKKYVW